MLPQGAKPSHGGILPAGKISFALGLGLGLTLNPIPCPLPIPQGGTGAAPSEFQDSGEPSY